jgi:hypothetical protein
MRKIKTILVNLKSIVGILFTYTFVYLVTTFILWRYWNGYDIDNFLSLFIVYGFPYIVSTIVILTLIRDDKENKLWDEEFHLPKKLFRR